MTVDTNLISLYKALGGGWQGIDTASDGASLAQVKRGVP
jgi:hypothetical protein